MAGHRGGREDLKNGHPHNGGGPKTGQAEMESKIGRLDARQRMGEANGAAVQNAALLARQKRLAAWKKKQAQKKSLMRFKTKAKTKQVRLNPLKRSGFGDDDDDEEEEEEEGEASSSRPKLKVSKVSVDQKERKGEDEGNDDSADVEPVDIDAYLHHLEQKEASVTKGVLVEDVVESDEEVSAESGLAKQRLQRIATRNRKMLPAFPPSQTPIFRQLYKESPFIAGMTEQEVAALRLRDGVTIKGRSVRPVLEWSQLGLPESIAHVIESLQFDSPTAIQSESLPNIMNGSDLIGIAKTGSGKTLAYTVPLFRHIMANEYAPLPKWGGSQPKALVMAPTRELALQIHKSATPFFEAHGLRGVCCYGGQPISQQISELKRACDVIVATPGRLIDLLCANNGHIVNLSSVSYLVLDEADRMFDMGFGPQVMKILDALRPDKQTVLFSATFPPKMESLAKKLLKETPVEIIIGSKNLINDSITQKFEVIEEEDKLARLLRLLGEFNGAGKVLIFRDRKDQCDQMSGILAERGYPAMSLHGGKEQVDRDSTISDFRDGLFDVLVATSVASRGLDIQGLNLVVNYDAPSHMEDYVHRVGRTGRAGHEGQSMTFVKPDQDKAASDIVRLLELSEQPVPQSLKKLSDRFRESIKTGDVKFSSGFGGKGLEKLAAIREEHRRVEQQLFKEASKGSGAGAGAGDDDDETRDSIPDLGTTASATSGAGALFDVKYAASSPRAFSATIVINDLPKEVRWAISNADNIIKITDSTGASITSKGRYYPPGQTPKSEKDEPKLYLFIEGPELGVRRAVEELKDSLVGGISTASEHTKPISGKYTLA